ncbi:hypothetical protein C3489_26115 [Streptomyces sp. Ru71]|uniref:hypothetical protein n=1 Tax=Streptomyces sp. Ru71 TaxID=2080746 RepID=UPI000CDD493C|nr:hypothetical protein [Streptomyces sp. Ru71]POX48915.1 hypothetical protein C3489_26115 [Streptomyces sp. Ru71]
MLLAAGAGPAWAAPGASSERDVQLVYCLDGPHRAGLVSAALRLRLLAPGSTAAPDAVRPAQGPGGAMSLQQWAERRTEDFGRACSALMAAASESPGTAAQGGGGGGWFTDFLKQLPLLAAGALLTLAGQSSERISAERRQLGQQLETEESAYRTAVQDYLAGYEIDPRADHSAVRAARTALVGTLGRVPGPRARRDAARAAADALPLARPLPGQRDGYLLDTESRGVWAEEQRGTVEDKLRLISGLNGRTVYWGWRTVRARLARRGAPGAGR